MSALVPAAAASDCQNCGTYVSDHFRRVFGDEQDLAHRCLDCDSKRRIESGSAAGQNPPIPDPKDQPERLRNEVSRP